jgi:DNA-binding response OmpR family regulator
MAVGRWRDSRRRTGPTRSRHGAASSDTERERSRKEPILHVLVIDDEPDILALCRVTLARDGHTVLGAATADAGLKLAIAERPDLIVLDIMLPNRDGFSLLEELVSGQDTRDVPVVLLTAKTRPQDRAKAWGCGASGYVTKPFTPATLNETVRLVGSMSPDERSAVRDQALSALDPGLSRD